MFCCTQFYLNFKKLLIKKYWELALTHLDNNLDTYTSSLIIDYQALVSILFHHTSDMVHYPKRVSLHGIMTNILDCDIVLRKNGNHHELVKVLDHNIVVIRRGNSFGMVANILDCDIIVSKFKLQSWYYVHFQTHTLIPSVQIVLLLSFYMYDLCIK